MPVVTNYPYTKGLLKPSACWNCWSASHVARRCPDPERKPFEREQLRLRKRAVKPRDPRYDDWLKQDLALRGNLREATENTRLTGPNIQPPPVVRTVPVAKKVTNSTEIPPAVSVSKALSNKTGNQTKTAALVPAGKQPQNNTSYFSGYYCPNCWLKDTHLTFNCPNPKLPIEEMESLRIKKGIPEYSWWRNVLLTARSNVLKQQRSAGTKDLDAEELPRGFHIAIGYYTRACWNCWSTRHEKQHCPKPILSIREAEILRVELGVPMPKLPWYQDMLAPYYCNNCWKSYEHLTNQCPEPYRGVKEREELRVKMGIKLVWQWAVVLKREGVEIMGKFKDQLGGNRMVENVVKDKKDIIGIPASGKVVHTSTTKKKKNEIATQVIQAQAMRPSRTKCELFPQSTVGLFGPLANPKPRAKTKPPPQCITHIPPAPPIAGELPLKEDAPKTPTVRTSATNEAAGGNDDLIDLYCEIHPSANNNLRTVLAEVYQELRGLRQHWRDLLAEVDGL